MAVSYIGSSKTQTGRLPRSARKRLTAISKATGMRMKREGIEQFIQCEGDTMIRHYIIGEPIETDSVVLNIPAETGEIPGFVMDPGAKAIRHRMDREDVIYGLGETVRGMNKRN